MEDKDSVSLDIDDLSKSSSSSELFESGEMCDISELLEDFEKHRNGREKDEKNEKVSIEQKKTKAESFNEDKLTCENNMKAKKNGLGNCKDTNLVKSTDYEEDTVMASLLHGSSSVTDKKVKDPDLSYSTANEERMASSLTDGDDGNHDYESNVVESDMNTKEQDWNKGDLNKPTTHEDNEIPSVSDGCGRGNANISSIENDKKGKEHLDLSEDDIDKSTTHEVYELLDTEVPARDRKKTEKGGFSDKQAKLKTGDINGSDNYERLESRKTSFEVPRCIEKKEDDGQKTEPINNLSRNYLKPDVTRNPGNNVLFNCKKTPVPAPRRKNTNSSPSSFELNIDGHHNRGSNEHEQEEGKLSFGVLSDKKAQTVLLEDLASLRNITENTVVTERKTSIDGSPSCEKEDSDHDIRKAGQQKSDNCCEGSKDESKCDQDNLDGVDVQHTLCDNKSPIKAEKRSTEKETSEFYDSENYLLPQYLTEFQPPCCSTPCSEEASALIHKIFDDDMRKSSGNYPNADTPGKDRIQPDGKRGLTNLESETFCCLECEDEAKIVCKAPTGDDKTSLHKKENGHKAKQWKVDEVFIEEIKDYFSYDDSESIYARSVNEDFEYLSKYQKETNLMFEELSPHDVTFSRPSDDAGDRRHQRITRPLRERNNHKTRAKRNQETFLESQCERKLEVDENITSDLCLSNVQTMSSPPNPKLSRPQDTHAPWLEKEMLPHSGQPTTKNLSSASKIGTLHVITFPLSRGPGIVVERSGTSKTAGIYVKDIIQGGDAFQDGRLYPGDRLLTVNGYNFCIASLLQAKSVLHRLKKAPSEKIANIRFLRDSDVDDRPVAADAIVDDVDSSLDRSMTLPFFFNETTFSEESPTDENDVPLHYLQEDLILPNPMMTSTPIGVDVVSTTKATSEDSFENSPSSSNVQHLQDGLLMIAPNTKVHLSQLESSLSYLGIDLSPHQTHLLRNQLDAVDSEGYVMYEDFARAARNIYSLELSKEGLEDSYSQKDLHPRSFTSPLPDIIPRLSIDSILASRKEFGRLFAEKDLIKDEILEIKKRFNDKAKALRDMELELVEVRNNLQRVKNRKLMLLKKDRELETARVSASSKIKEHKTAISSLEQEIKNLKASNVPITSQMISKSASVNKQIQNLVTQIRSAEQSNRNYHNVTQKLMAFAHKVHRLLHDDQHRNKHVDTSLSDHTYQVVDCMKGVETGVDNKKQFLSREARRIIDTVKGILSYDSLPFGWEEAYTERGSKFYIDHASGVTTWQTPKPN